MIAIDSTIITLPSWMDAHLLQQPDDPEPSSFAKDGDHVRGPFLTGNPTRMLECSACRSMSSKLRTV